MQLFVDVTALIDISTVLSAISMFVLIISEQIEQNFRQQQEIARQRASVNVLQMRPHFIYNTMMSIYYLIAQDTDKAQKITLDFSTYLRKNFTALATDGTVPFTEELEHTRAYLEVEQTRFEDNLFVEFDTPHTRFRVPPLTLQPIVENAIKHGLDPELSPLHITIKTRQTENGSVITVEDTGPGFGVNDNNEPHVALANIKERLEMMCKGTLKIDSTEDKGTTVTIFVPIKK
ncbi:MAG: histidine kinase [Eubacterium sp.]|nr:histidine kinase [Eubacterium sp.]